MPAQSLDQLRSRVAGLRNAKKAAAEPEDPTNKGTVATPNHPDGDSAEKTGVPAQSRPQNTQTAEDGITENGGAGEMTPPTPDSQNAKDDAAQSPTTPLSKIAGDLSETAKRLVALRKSASAPSGNGSAPAQQKSAGAPAQKQPAEGGDDNGQPKQAGHNDLSGLELTDEYHIKLASELLATQEGVDFATDYLTRRASSEVANEMITKAAAMQDGFRKYAAHQKAAYEQAVNETAILATALLQAGEETQSRFAKQAAHHQQVYNSIEDDSVAEFYKAGALDAAMLEQAMADQGVAPEGELPMMAGAGEAPDPAQVEMVLGALEAQGVLQPGQAQELFAAFQGGGEAPAPEAPPASGGGESSSDSSGDEGQTKEASAEIDLEEMAQRLIA